jgi:hypothetical protein
MSTWIEASLSDAVAALVRSGEKEIAAALGRLLGEPELRELQLYRAPRVAALADEIYDCDSLDALYDRLPAVADAFGATHCTIHCVRDRGATVFSKRVLTTYSDAWVKEYVAKRYATVDPVMTRSFGEPGMFFWDELPRTSPMTGYFLEKAAAHGVGPSGVTLVSSDAEDNRIAVTLAASSDPAAFRQAFRPRLSDFADLAPLMIEVFAEFARARPVQAPIPTDDQLKVLRALMCGQSLEEIRRRHIAYGSFDTLVRSILRTFGARTLHQAAALAARMGVLEDLPYFEDDIHQLQRDPERPPAATEPGAWPAR